MKKFFGIGKKKKSGPSPSPSDTGSVLSLGYELKDKELSKLHRAAAAGDVAKIRQLLHKHDINQLDKENRTPLHLACANGHPDAVKLLVENKAKLNLCDNDSRTPLIKAIQCQHEQCATILLEHEADPDVVDVNGNSALHLAALIPSMSVAIQLLEHRANIDAVNKDGCTPLILAVAENHQEIVEFLIKEGSSINARDKNGRSSLMIAAGNGQISLVKCLLQNNADISVKDETGWSADDHAVMNSHHACSHLIIEHGSKHKHPASLYGAGKKGPSVFSSPDRVVEGGFTLGSPALDKEDLQVASKQKSRKKDSEKGTEDLSQADTESRISGKVDSWASSDEEDFSPKKTSKPSLAQLLNTKKSDKTKSQVFTRQAGKTNNKQKGEDEVEESNKEEETGEEDDEDDDEDVEEGNDHCEDEDGSEAVNDEGEEGISEEEDDDDDDDDDDNEDEDDVEEEKQSEEDEDNCNNDVSKDAEKYSEENEGPIDEADVDDDEENHRKEVAVKLDAVENDHGQSNEITEPDHSACARAAQADGCQCPPLAEQDAEISDSNDVPVSLIYGTPENAGENETSLMEGDVTNFSETCVQTEQHIKDSSDQKELKENIQTSKGDDTTCLLQSSQTNACEHHEESFSGSEDQEENEDDDESPQHSNAAGQAKVQAAGDGGRKVALMSELGFEDDDVESPWDSESASDSPRKQSASEIPPPAAPDHMQCISEESNEDVSEKCAVPELNKPQKTVLHINSGSSARPLTKANEKKSDLMEDLGLDDADDLEDASDWDSTSHSLKNTALTPRGVTQSHHKLYQSTAPQAMLDGSLPRDSAELPPMTLSSVQEDDIEDHTQQKIDSIQSIPKGKSEESPNHKGLSNWKPVNEDQNYIKMEREKTNVNVQMETSTDLETAKLSNNRKSKESDGNRPELQLETNIQPTIKSKPSSYKEKNGKFAIDSVLSGSNPKSLLEQGAIKAAFKQHSRSGNGDLLEALDDSTLSETSQKDGKRITEKPIDGKSTVNDDEDMDDFSQSSDSVTEEFEVPTSAYRNAMLLIEQLNHDGQDFVNLLKIQNIIHEYERVLEKENKRHALLAHEVKKLREERKELRQMTEKNRELKSLLEYNKVEWDSDVSSLRSNLKQEEEKRKSAEMLHDMSKEQFRRKEEQCQKEMEEKQQLELTLRNLELEIRSLRNNMKQVEEERSEAQRLYAQEHSSRLLQEEAYNNLKRRNEEEESRRLLAKNVEQVLGQPSEAGEKVRDLSQKNLTLQDEINLLKHELDQVRSHYRDDESRYLDETDALKEKVDDLRKDLKVNEETLTQTVIQCNGQLNALKTETSMLCSKLEHEKQSKEKLETELDSARSRLNSALQDLERSQASKTDTERTLQRERDEWLRSNDKLNHDLSNLRENNNNLSQQLSRAEAKSNSLENDLHRTSLSLQEKAVLLESSQRDLKQTQSRIKDLEKTLQAEKDQINKSSIKQETMQERLSQITSENMQLRQQLEDAQNKGIIKEKAVSDVQDRFTDIFSKLRADTERQVQIVEERNKDLINKSNELREQVYKLETEKVERESAIRQLQQELADALKKLSMSEASLEVITRYRNDLEEEKQYLHKELERFRAKVQDLEEQFLQSERRNHQLKNLLDDKEREVMTAFQKVQELSTAAAGSEKSAKQLEEHIQKLEIENAKIEATAKQQLIQIEKLQKELQESISIKNRLEDLVTGLQTSKIGLEEKVNQQVHKQTVLSQSAQDSHNLWEEELKSRSRLGVRLAELERSNTELVEQVENEKKKGKKLLDQRKSMEERFDQEIKRNTDLQREISGLKKLLKSAKKKLKEFEAGERQPNSLKEGHHRNYHETDSEVFALKKKIEDLSLHLERESRNYMQLEASNRDLHEQLSSMKSLHKNHERLERSKRQLEEEVSDLRRQVGSSKMDQTFLEQYKREIDERGRQELRQKLEEVNVFLQAQAASKDKLEQLRAENDSTIKNQLEHRIEDLESELHKIKNIQEESMSQKDSTLSEMQRVKDLYAEEQKMRKSLASKLERANERLADANTKLLNERQRSKSLIASSFLNGSLTGNPLLNASPLGGLGSSPALSRSLGLSGSFLNSVGSGLTANEMGVYFTKMQQELEKNIAKELDQANAELDTGCTRVSPVGSIAGSMRNLSSDQDLVSQARQQYLEVLNKNYKI